MRVSIRTVARWSKDGKLPPPVRVGGVRRWLRRDIEMLIRGGLEKRDDGA